MGTYIKALKNYEDKLKIKKKGITITVSGQSGSGKTTIAKAIAKALKLRYVNVGDIFRKLAKKKKIKLEEFAKIRSSRVDIEADEKTLELAKKGNVVLNGRLTGWVAGDNADVRVFVDCSLDVRAERTALRDKKTVLDTKEDLIDRDMSDMKAYRKLYGVQIADKRIYDMIINNTKMSFSDSKKVPVQLIRQHIIGLIC
jgi:cytidylate kinase